MRFLQLLLLITNMEFWTEIVLLNKKFSQVFLMNWYEKMKEGCFFVFIKGRFAWEYSEGPFCNFKGHSRWIILVITPTEVNYPTSLKLKIFSLTDLVFSIAMHHVKRKQHNESRIPFLLAYLRQIQWHLHKLFNSSYKMMQLNLWIEWRLYNSSPWNKKLHPFSALRDFLYLLQINSCLFFRCIEKFQKDI